MISTFYLLPIITFSFVGGAVPFPTVALRPNLLLVELSHGHTIIGQDIVLTCQSSFYPNHTSVEWIVPKGVDLALAKQEESHVTANNTSHYIITYKLTIYQPTQHHSGSYMCEAVHKKWTKTFRSNQVWVPVYDVNEHMIEFSKNNVFNQAEPAIQVWIRAHPNISVTWLDRFNKTITDDSPNQLRIETGASTEDTYFNYYTVLEFKRLVRADFGVYTVIVETNFERKSQTFYVNLPWNTVQVTKGLKRVEGDSKKCMYTCKTVSYPKKKMFHAFNTFNLSTHPNFRLNSPLWDIQVVTPVEDNGLILADYHFFNFSSNPVVLFTCGIYEGKDTAIDGPASSFLLCPRNDFDIIGDDVINIDNKPRAEVGFGRKVTMTAVLSLYSYTKEMNLYLNSQKLDQWDVIYAKGADKVICLKTIFYFADYLLGEYTFEAVTNRGEIDTKTIEIIPKTVPIIEAQVTIRNLKNGHYVEGEDINIECTSVFHKHGQVRWTKIIEMGPFYKGGTDFRINQTYSVQNSSFITTSQLTVFNAKALSGLTFGCEFYEMEGTYGVTLTTKDKVEEPSLRVVIFNVNDSAIHYDYRRAVFLREKVQIRIKVLIFPKPSSIQWFKDNDTIPLPESTPSFSISNEPLENQNEYNCTLTFKNFGVKDFGNYTIVVKIGNLNKSHTVEVNVTGKPSTTIDNWKSNRQNKSSLIQCRSISYPEATIRWYFEKCKNLTYCLALNQVVDGEVVEKRESRFEKQGLLLTSYLSVNLSEHGRVRCVSTNNYGTDNSTKWIIVPVDGLEIFAENLIAVEGKPSVVETIHGEELKIWCIASLLSFKDQIQWYSTENFEHFQLVEGSKFEHLDASLSEITISVNESTQRYYICNSVTINSTLKSKYLLLNKREQASLYFYKSNMVNSSVHVQLGAEWTFFCYVDGFPNFTVEWFKNGESVTPSETLQIRNNSQELHFQNVDTDDAGSYSCQASNRYKRVETTATLVPAIDLSWFYAVIAVVVTTFVTLVSYITWKTRKQRKLLQELKLADMSYFEKGALESLNPDLGIEEQAHVLPYHQKWEVPREKLILGKPLGSGAFGVVFAAEIVDFFPDESSKTVAVKTIDRHSRFECVKVLVSELKIMVHLGKHINIVNLLGACTKNILQRELYVIVEYCQFGSLHDYMLRFGNHFIDQKNYETDQYEWTSSFTTFKEENRLIGEVAEGEINCSYKSDLGEETASICSQDLVIWSLQITQGMEYLGSRRIVHGDLAARNILLTDNNVIKISDFGLSRQMYNYQNYVKTGKGPLPVKWLAIETHKRGIFSIQSDVWAFGIVLWELFSLGDVPYPGLAANQTFKLLLTGYRMESPRAATHSVYETMLDCWHSDPLQRPSFTDLAEKIGSLLKIAVKNHYLDMNGGYLEMNQRDVENGDDILMKLSPRNYQNCLSEEDKLRYLDMSGGYLEMDNEAGNTLMMLSPRNYQNIVASEGTGLTSE